MWLPLRATSDYGVGTFSTITVGAPAIEGEKRDGAGRNGCPHRHRSHDRREVEVSAKGGHRNLAAGQHIGEFDTGSTHDTSSEVYSASDPTMQARSSPRLWARP